MAGLEPHELAQWEAAFYALHPELQQARRTRYGRPMTAVMVHGDREATGSFLGDLGGLPGRWARR